MGSGEMEKTNNLATFSIVWLAKHKGGTITIFKGLFLLEARKEVSPSLRVFF